MTDQIRADNGYVEQETVSGGDLGATAGQYDSGGTTLPTDLGRADEAQVNVDNPNYQVIVTGTTDGDITFELYEGTVDTTTSNATESVSWTEVADNTDISADNFTYTATRQ